MARITSSWGVSPAWTMRMSWSTPTRRPGVDHAGTRVRVASHDHPVAHERVVRVPGESGAVEVGPEPDAVQGRRVVPEIPPRGGAGDGSPAAIVRVAVRRHERRYLEVGRDAEEVRRVGHRLGRPVRCHRRRQLLGRHRGESENAQPRAGRAGEGRLARRRDPQRRMRLLDGLRHELPLGNLVVPALVSREGVVDEEGADHPEGLVPDLSRLLDRDAECLGVVPGGAPAGAQVQTSVREDVERGRALGHPDRVVTGQHDHTVPQPDPGGAGRQRGQEHLRRRAVGDLLVEVVFGRPVVVEPDLLGQHGLGERVPVDPMVDVLALEPGLGRLHLRDEAELHGRACRVVVPLRARAFVTRER